MPHLAPAIAAPSTAGPGVVGQHLGHAGRYLPPRRQVDELVRAVGIRARSHHAGDEELRLGKALTEHAHEGDGPSQAVEHRRGAEVALRRAPDGVAKPRGHHGRVPAATWTLAR